MSDRQTVAPATRVMLMTLCIAVHGCTDVHGGAVELSWKLRPWSGAKDDFLPCVPPDLTKVKYDTIAQIRLDWDVTGETPGHRNWPCTDEEQHGVTGFELPPGDALLTVSPVCSDGSVANAKTYIAPAAELRRVIVGNTISLGAVEIVLQTSDCERQLCICQCVREPENPLCK